MLDLSYKVTEDDYTKLSKKIRALLSKEDPIKLAEEKILIPVKIPENGAAFFKIFCSNRPCPVSMEIRKRKGIVNLYTSRSIKRPQNNVASERISGITSHIYRFNGGIKERQFSCEFLFLGFYSEVDSSFCFQIVFGDDSFPSKMNVSSRPNETKINTFDRPGTQGRDLHFKLQELHRNEDKFKELNHHVSKIKKKRKDNMFKL